MSRTNEPDQQQINRLYPDLTEALDYEEEKNQSICDQNDSMLNKTLEVDVEDDCSPKLVSKYNLRSSGDVTDSGLKRRPLHGNKSLGSKSPRQNRKSPKGSPLTERINRDHIERRISPGQRSYTYREVNYQKESSSHSRSTPKRNLNKDTAYDDDNKYYLIKPLCVVCALLLLLIVLVFVVIPAYRSKNISTPQSNDDVAHKFKIEFKDMRRRFPAQSDRFWKVLKSSMKWVLKEEDPLQPAVLMLPSVGHNHVTADCIANQFAELVTRVFKSPKLVEFKCHDYYGRNKDDIKLSLDTDLKHSFRAGSKAAVLYRLNKLPAQTAMLLHAYCDNENAPYKKVALIFTLHINREIAQSSAAEADSVVEDYLDEVWGDMNVDDRRALLSRVANNIAFVTDEAYAVLEQNCS